MIKSSSNFYRMTSDTTIRHSKNIQYTYVVNDTPAPTVEPNTNIEFIEKSAEPACEPHHQEELAYAESLRKKILRDRNSFRKELSRNSLYVNENFIKPWKLVSR